MLNPPPDMALSGCIPFYLQLCSARGQSDKTVAAKASNLSLFSAWCEQHQVSSVMDIDLAICEHYQCFLNQYRTRSGQRLCRGTIRNRLTAVKLFLRALFNRSLITDSGFEKLELPRCGRVLPRPVLSMDEVKRIIHQPDTETAAGVRDAVMLELYYATALRRSELADLTMDNLDLPQQQLKVCHGKGFKDRLVPIAPDTCEKLRVYINQIRPKLTTLCSGNTVFVATVGKPFRPTQLSELIAGYIKKAGITKGGACNQLRHAAATHLYEGGADLRAIQMILGHADISTTQVYVHVSLCHVRKIYLRAHPLARHKL
ncbi:tyrosine-type recombinase/integrase [Pseudoalteromonas viridis]|uniref:Tyrosine-type recombinase/integrase n=2 Tax=Pseudoalteromonas TaxID=53246 RepID=A0ABX7V9W0_9GAMM|nr:tyrosine-type recombinase/integrase [Pseudoalteromonas viridis]QTL36556.1 tyrosine-type recombinase/integrase [Pseudoalteromonas viridis]